MREYSDREEFKRDAKLKGLLVNDMNPEHENFLYWQEGLIDFATNQDGENVGYFDISENQGEIFDSPEEFNDAMDIPGSRKQSTVQQEFNDLTSFTSAAQAKGFSIEPAEAEPNVNAWNAVFAYDPNGNAIGYFDEEVGEGELFSSYEDFDLAMNQMPVNASVVAAPIGSDIVKNTISYLRQNKDKLLEVLKGKGGTPSIQKELQKIPAGAGPKGSLVAQSVMQWLSGQLNDVALTDNLEKILQGKQSALGEEDNLQDYDADGETDLNKYGAADMKLLSDQELLECYSEAEEALEKGDKSAYEEIKACEKELQSRGLNKNKVAETEDHWVYSPTEYAPGTPMTELTPEVEDLDEKVVKVFGGPYPVVKSNKGVYYVLEDGEVYFMAYAKGHVPEWVLKQEEVQFTDEDKDFLKNMNIQGKKRASIKTPKTAAPQVVAFASEIEEVLKNLILGRVRDVMKKLGSNQDTQGIKDIYFQLDEALHKALKIAQNGSKQISDNLSKLKESNVKDVEVIAEQENSVEKKEAAMEDLDDYVVDIMGYLDDNYSILHLYELYKTDRGQLANIIVETAHELFPLMEFKGDTWNYISTNIFNEIKSIGSGYIVPKDNEELGNKFKDILYNREQPIKDNLEFEDKDKEILKNMGIQGSFARFNACMEDGGMEHVVEVMAPTEIEGLATALPENYNEYPELSSVKDLLVDALVKINEYEAGKVASDHDHNCEDCTGDCEHHNHADTADSNTSATVDTTEQGIESPYAEHDAVYASLDSVKLMVEASKFAAKSKSKTKVVKDVDDAPTDGDNVENAEKNILDIVDENEELTVADLQNKLLALKFRPQIAQLAISNCFGPEALLVLSTPVCDLE